MAPMPEGEAELYSDELIFVNVQTDDLSCLLR